MAIGCQNRVKVGDFMDDTKNEQQVIMSLNDMEGISKFIEDNQDEQTIIRITIET